MQILAIIHDRVLLLQRPCIFALSGVVGNEMSQDFSNRRFDIFCWVTLIYLPTCCWFLLIEDRMFRLTFLLISIHYLNTYFPSVSYLGRLEVSLPIPEMINYVSLTNLTLQEHWQWFSLCNSMDHIYLPISPILHEWTPVIKGHMQNELVRSPPQLSSTLRPHPVMAQMMTILTL